MGVVENFNPAGASYESLQAMMKKVREEEPVFYWAEQDVWVATRYEDCQKILGDADHFSNEGNLEVLNGRYCPEAKAVLASGIDWNATPQLNGTEGERHTRLRGVMQSILTPKRFREMEPVIRSNVTRLIDGFIADGRCDFITRFAYPLPVYVIFEIIGFRPEEEDLATLQQWSDATFSLWLAVLDPDAQVECAKKAIEFQNYMRGKIADRRANPRDDLLTEFVRELDSGQSRLSEEEAIILFPMNLIGAGHETTKSALGNALYHMLSDRSRWDQIVRDPSIIPAAVEETLRFDGSVFGWYRTVTSEVELGGKTLPAGAKVIAAMGSANHDENRFEASDSFCPARRNKPPHLTFSFGRHFCLGAPLARMEMRIALEELSRRLPNLRLAPGQDVRFEPAVATRTIGHLAIEWDARA